MAINKNVDMDAWMFGAKGTTRLTRSFRYKLKNDINIIASPKIVKKYPKYKQPAVYVKLVHMQFREIRQPIKIDKRTSLFIGKYVSEKVESYAMMVLPDLSKFILKTIARTQYAKYLAVYNMVLFTIHAGKVIISLVEFVNGIRRAAIELFECSEAGFKDLTEDYIAVSDAIKSGKVFVEKIKAIGEFIGWTKVRL